MGTKGTISQDLSDLLTTKNFDPVYTDETGRDSSPAEAVVFSFDYVAGSGKNYGTAVAVLGDQNDLQFFFGDNLGRSIDNPADKNDWFQFLEQLSNFATQHRYTFSPKDINQLKHTMAGIAAIKEGLFEGYYGTRKVSYMGEATEARLVIKHKKALEENDRRHLYVESLFIETADGERFKLPFRKLTGGRAMLEHVRQGGKPYDIRGCHIAEMVNEINLLARFNRASHGRVFEGNTAQLVESAQAYYHTLQENLKHLASNRGYQVYFESWTPADIGAEDALVEDIKTLFVEQSIDARIEAALPTLLKIQQQEQVMKEAQIFENWINHLAEGTWALPDTPEQQAKLEELMSAELIAGPDGANATEQLYDLVGDDQLFDLIGAAAEADPNVNIWDVPEVVDRLQELGVEVPVNQAADEQTPQAVSESHMSEVDSIIQDLISGEADAYNLLTSPTTPEEQYVSNILRKEYEDVSIDHGLHPDDDFEEIIDRVLDRLAQDYGHNVAEADSPYFAETTVAGSVAPVVHEMAEGVTSPEIKQAYKDIMNTAPRTPERKSAVRKYLKLHADALDKQRKEQGVAEGLNEFAPDGFNSGGDGSGKSGKGPKARAKAQMIKAYGPGIITFRKTSNGGYFVQHEDDFGDTNSHQYDPQTGKVDFSGVTRSSYYGEGVAEGVDNLLRKYYRNENDNLHSENVVLLAQHFGTPSELRMAKQALAYRNEQGGFDYSDPKAKKYLMFQQEINKKYYPLLKRQGVAEGSGQLSIQQLATISDEALDKAYGYGRSTPGNSFGWQANLMSAAYAKKMIDAGVTDIEKISDAIHKGWNVTAQKFVQDPDQFGDTEKLRQAGKLEAKLQQRAKLMKINYAQLDNEEQEKDRVVARALLQAIKGQQGVAEGGQQAFVNPHHNDPINANSAITSSYYEGEDPLARLKSLALSK